MADPTRKEKSTDGRGRLTIGMDWADRDCEIIIVDEDTAVVQFVDDDAQSSS